MLYSVIENIESMSMAGRLMILLGIIIFVFFFLIPLLILFIKHFIALLKAKAKQKRVFSLKNRLKEFFLKTKYMIAFALFALLISTAWFALFMFGFWGLMTGIPIVLAILAILREGRIIRQGRCHAVELSGINCACGEETRDVFVVEASGRRRLLYRECYNCKARQKE